MTLLCVHIYLGNWDYVGIWLVGFYDLWQEFWRTQHVEKWVHAKWNVKGLFWFEVSVHSDWTFGCNILQGKTIDGSFCLCYRFPCTIYRWKFLLVWRVYIMRVKFYFSKTLDHWIAWTCYFLATCQSLWSLENYIHILGANIIADRH